jgi:hypothetical protein
MLLPAMIGAGGALAVLVSSTATTELHDETQSDLLAWAPSGLAQPQQQPHMPGWVSQSCCIIPLLLMASSRGFPAGYVATGSTMYGFARWIFTCSYYWGAVVDV